MTDVTTKQGAGPVFPDDASQDQRGNLPIVAHGGGEAPALGPAFFTNNARSERRDASVHRALALLGPFPENWVPLRQEVDTDVLVVGAGQSGLALAFALRRAGIARVRLIDAAPRGEQGVWHQRARMPTLRTPKVNPALELGVPELSFEAWHYHEYGAAAFAGIEKAATADWARYLDWYRDVLGIAVEYETRLVDVSPGEANGLSLQLEHNGQRQTVTTRKLVLATGLAGSGQPRIPALVRAALPTHVYQHSIDVMDAEAFAGQRVGVIGASASAFDLAGLALEHGAVGVDMLSRRTELVRIAKFAAAAYPGGDFVHLLSDAERWALSCHYLDQGSPPPIKSVERACRHEAFRLHFQAGLESVAFVDGHIQVHAGGRAFQFDRLVCATGFETDLALRPELSAAATLAATWGDRVPAAAESGNRLSRFPYLGLGLNLQERGDESDAWIRNIHLFNYAAHVNVGRSVGDVSSVRRLVPRVVDAIAADFFLQDKAAQWQRLNTLPTGEGLDERHYGHRVVVPARDLV